MTRETSHFLRSIQFMTPAKFSEEILHSEDKETEPFLDKFIYFISVLYQLINQIIPNEIYFKWTASFRSSSINKVVKKTSIVLWIESLYKYSSPYIKALFAITGPATLITDSYGGNCIFISLSCSLFCLISYAEQNSSHSKPRFPHPWVLYRFGTVCCVTSILFLEKQMARVSPNPLPLRRLLLSN